MHWIQEEQSRQYHVIQWKNSAFHNHDMPYKRKLLGGVSFDGGGSVGSGKTEGKTEQTMSTETKPYGSVSYETGFGSGMKGNTAGIKSIKAGKRNINIGTNREKSAVSGKHVYQMALTAAGSIIEKLASVIMPVQGVYRRSFMPLRYTGKIHSIQTSLQGMEQKTGKESRQEQKKHNTTGTRGVTKEEVYRIETESAYLLDSYNKYGERSILGK